METIATNRSQRAETLPQGTWLERNFYRLLVAIAVAGLILRLVFGSCQFVSFDGWWHLFIATQDRWLILLGEWKGIAHPPLFYPLLRFVAALSHSLLMIRSIGIVCGGVSSVVIGIVAAKIYRCKASALLAAAAYTFAWSIIEMNCDVRAYPLALLFVLLAFNAFLDWTADPANAHAGRAIVRFTVYSLLALLSEYYVIFFLAGCLGLLALRALLRPAFRAAFLNSLRVDLEALAVLRRFPVDLVPGLFRISNDHPGAGSALSSAIHLGRKIAARSRRVPALKPRERDGLLYAVPH